MTRPRKSTSIRNARRASIERKRGAFGTGRTPNKKPGIAPGLYTFPATGNPCKATGSEPNPRTTEDQDHEFCN